MPDRPAWVWSDLHLHHRKIIRNTKRPFASCEQMDGVLHGAWRQAVGGADEHVLCGGDVALAGSLNALRLDRVATAPGRKLLVLGNHDVDAVNQVRPFEIDRTAVTLYAAGDPPLLLTHVPLPHVPHGAVNVHGHVHEQ